MANYKDLPIVTILDSCELCAKGCDGFVSKSESGMETYKSVGFWYNRYYFHDTCEEAFLKSLDEIKSKVKDGYPFLLCYERNNENAFFDKLLVKNGFMLLFTQSGMNIKLEDFNANYDSSSIKLITKDELKSWSEVVAKAFDKPYEDECFFAMMNANDDNAKFYAYYEDGKMVGTTLTYLKDGVLGIHEVSVLPEYQRKGIARNLIAKALMDAKASGAKYASLQASPTGKLLYESMGFELINEIQNVVLRPKE